MAAVLQLEHAIGCNVKYPELVHWHLDGKYYIYGAGGSVVIASLVDSVEQYFLHGHDYHVSCLALSHQGDLIASAQNGRNSDVVIWEYASRQLRYRFSEHDNKVSCVAFTHDDRYLASCGGTVEQRIYFYDVSTGLIVTCTKLFSTPTWAMTSGGFVRNLKRRDTNKYQLATCGKQMICLWSFEAIQGEVHFEKVVMGNVTRDCTCLRFAHDYEWLYAGTCTGEVACISMRSMSLQTLLPICSKGVTSLLALPSGNLLIGGGDGTLAFFSGCGKTFQTTFQIRLDGDILSLTPSPDYKEGLAASTSGTIRRFSLDVVNSLTSSKPSDSETVAVIAQNPSTTLTAVHHPLHVNDQFLTAEEGGSIVLWDANDFSYKFKCNLQGKVFPTSLSASSDILISGWSDGRIRGYEMQSGGGLWQIDNAHNEGVTSLDLSRTMRSAVSAGNHGDLRWWDLRTPKMICHLKQHVGRVNQVNFFATDVFALSVGKDSSLLTWDLEKEKRLTAHYVKRGGISAAAIATDQTTVLTVGHNRILSFWDLRQRRVAQEVELQEEAFTIALAPTSNRWFCTGGTSQRVYIWELRNPHHPRQSASAHSGDIKAVSFSSDEKQIVSVGGVDQTICVWNLFEEQQSSVALPDNRRKTEAAQHSNDDCG